MANLDEIAKRRTELNKRESAIVRIFNIKDDHMSKYLSKRIEWDVLGRILMDIRKELEEQSKIIRKA